MANILLKIEVVPEHMSEAQDALLAGQRWTRKIMTPSGIKKLPPGVYTRRGTSQDVDAVVASDLQRLIRDRLCATAIVSFVESNGLELTKPH